MVEASGAAQNATQRRRPRKPHILIETAPSYESAHVAHAAAANAPPDPGPPDPEQLSDETAAPHVALAACDDPLAEPELAEPEMLEPSIQDPAPPGFAELGLSEPILRAIAEMGYTTPTPIQRQAIPFVLMGRDVLGSAQTGTGKTAGFTLPMLDILSGSRARARMPRSLILEPTRELALQVAENFVMYGRHLRLTHALVIGGESMSDQRETLMRGVDVLIATPGRLIDQFERGGILLSDCALLVIDEADRMLDMGFIPDVERIVAMLPGNRQTLFFSATMAPEIKRLADAFLRNPKEITVSKPASVVTTITQAMTLVADHDKREALRRLVRSEEVQNALIFCNRKKDVDILFKSLSRHGFSVGALHGDMAQPVRFATLEKFKAGETRLLCCSDVAARGIDIGGLSHVFNFDVPIHAEDYVHRIGRTGRAGREGRAFMLATPDDQLAVAAIEKLTGHPVPRMQIPGLDPVEWAEGDGRKRRGRGGRAAAKPDKKTDAKPEKSARPEKPARKEAKRAGEPRDELRAEGAAPVGRPVIERPIVERPIVERLARPASVPRAGAPRSDATRSDGRRSDARRPRAEAPRPPEPAPPAVDSRPPREARRPERQESRREERRDERRLASAEPASGAAVVGFGAEVPAFMRVAARRNSRSELEESAP